MAEVAPLIRSLRVSARLSRKSKQKSRASRASATRASKAGSLALVPVEQHALLQDMGPLQDTACVARCFFPLQEILAPAQESCCKVFRRRDRVLDLGGAGLGDAAATAVAAAWAPLRKLGLERLHLGGNDISDAGLTD